jgi:hypothetical protein
LLSLKRRKNLVNVATTILIVRIPVTSSAISFQVISQSDATETGLNTSAQQNMANAE